MSGGYKKYLQALGPRLREDRRVHDLLVVVPPASREELRETFPGCTSWEFRGASGGLPALRESVTRWGPDVVFVPNAFPIRIATAATVTMPQNMEVMAMPVGRNSTADAIKNLVRRRRTKAACRSSDRIIAISKFVRDFLTEKWSVPEERIGVVYFGVDPCGPEADEPPARSELAGRRYVLSVGSIRPYRGLEDLVGALGHLENLDLVIAGEADRGSVWYQARLHRMAVRERVAGRVIWAGPVDPGQLPSLMRHAVAFAMTSRVEACPNVALEALSAGARIVSTRSPPMPEIFGAAAEYYEAGDTRGLATTIATIDGDGDIDRRQRARASAIAASFTWSDTARRTVDELERAVLTRSRAR